MNGAVGFAALGTGQLVETLIRSGDPLKVALGIAIFVFYLWLGVTLLRLPSERRGATSAKA